MSRRDRARRIAAGARRPAGRVDPAFTRRDDGLPAADALTEAGLPLTADGAGRVLVIACGALAREIVALRRLNGLDGLALTCLPAIWHNTPERIVPGLKARIAEARARGYGRIFVAYADCGTGGGIDRLCADEGVERIAGPHCYAFFDGNAAFAARAEEEIAAFYLTDFLARQFDTLIWKGFGLDRHPELRAMMFGRYDRLVYLAQTDDAALDARARATADRLGLRFERRDTGYGELADFIARAAAASPLSRP